MESGELSIPSTERDIPSAPASQVYGRSSAKYVVLLALSSDSLLTSSFSSFIPTTSRFRGGKKRLISDSIPTFSEDGNVEVFKGGAANAKRAIAPIPDSIPTSSEGGVLKVFTGGSNARRGEEEERAIAPIPDSIPTYSDGGVLKVFTGGNSDTRRSEDDMVMMAVRATAPIPDSIPTSSEGGVLKVFTGGANTRRSEGVEVVVERAIAPIPDSIPTSSEGGVLKVFTGGAGAKRGLEDDENKDGQVKRAVAFGRSAMTSYVVFLNLSCYHR